MRGEVRNNPLVTSRLSFTSEDGAALLAQAAD